MLRLSPILALALLAFLALSGCGYDTCDRPAECGDPCWTCALLGSDCEDRPPEGHCNAQGKCKDLSEPVSC